MPATALFREMGFEAGALPRRPYVYAAVGIAIVLALLAIWFSGDRRIATIFVGAVVFSFIVLRSVGQLVQWLAKKSPRVRSVALRLAVGNIHRPGALTPSVVLSLGLGLTLLVTLALIDGNLRQQIAGSLPERAPNFFFVDIQSTEVEKFAAFVAKEAPAGELMRVPMLRGRIVELNGVDVQKVEVPPEGAWVLRGDRGVTYDAKLPENATLAEGEWWPEDYSGEPLVSFSADEAREIGLKIGDTVTVNVLGRDITARIANLRKVEWESMGINFVMVFSPNTFAGAPHSWLATLMTPDATTADEARLLNAVTRTFPAVTTVRVKDALDVVNRIVGQLGTAIRRRGQRGADRLGAGAVGRAGGRQPRPHPRRRGAEDARRDAQDADRRLLARICADRARDRRLRAVRRRRGRLVRRRAHHAAAVELPAGGGGRDGDRGAGADGRLRPRRHLAGARPQGGAGAAQPVDAGQYARTDG